MGVYLKLCGYPSKMLCYLKDVINEAKSITFPDLNSVLLLMAIVAIVAGIAAFFFIFADFLSGKFIFFLMKL